MEDVSELFQCKNLKTLYLQGNIVTDLPHYRHHVISGLTELKVLDGKVIRNMFTQIFQNLCEFFFQTLSVSKTLSSTKSS